MIKSHQSSKHKKRIETHQKILVHPLTSYSTCSSGTNPSRNLLLREGLSEILSLFGKLFFCVLRTQLQHNDALVLLHIGHPVHRFPPLHTFKSAGLRNVRVSGITENPTQRGFSRSFSQFLLARIGGVFLGISVSHDSVDE